MIGLGQIGRYVKVAGAGLESGRASSQAMAMKNAGLTAMPPKDSTQLLNRQAANQMLDQSKFLERTAGRKLRSVDKYAELTGLDNSYSAKVADTFRKVGQFTEPVLTPAMGLGRGAGRMAGSVMNNPIGMTAVGFAPFMLMGSGGAPMPESGMVDPMTGGMIPPMPLPQGMPQEFAPMPTALNDEQIARAKKRAEEQAALNQFYAQSLQQYQG